VRTFQITSVFPRLTVRENIAVSAQFHYGAIGPVYRRSSRRAIAAEVSRIVETLGLTDLVDQAVGLLSYGDQRVVEIGIAMALRPRLLLLDEPTAGMSPAETSRIVELISALKASVTIIIIEHDMEVVREIADQVTVLNFGGLVAEGTFAEISASPSVRQIYFGNEAC
jgi:branched-chain amino acid transport system ATP-binding protein